MGCDIHMVVELRVGSKWIGVNGMHHVTTHKRREDDLGFAIPIASTRNYQRFARLAGVRGDGPEPKGLPEDISDLTRLEVEGWDGDGHSHSWLPLKEAARIWLETDRYDNEVDPESYEAKFPASHFFGVDDSRADDYRVVFWFDN